MEQRHLAEVVRERDQVLDAEGVDLEGFVQRRVEVDDARRVDHRVDATAQVLSERSVEPTERMHDVAPNGRDLLPEKGFEAFAVLVPKRLQALVLGDFLPEPLLRTLTAALADDQVQMPDVGVLRQ